MFNGDRGEMLLLDSPPAAIAARAVLVIGMGDPDDWSPAVTASAVQGAFVAAGIQGAASVAFAPSMLDAGLDPDRVGDAGDRMVAAVADAIDLDARLMRDGLTQGSSVHDWIFDVGAARFDTVLASFGAALRTIGPPGS